MAGCVTHNFIKHNQDDDKYFNMRTDPMPPLIHMGDLKVQTPMHQSLSSKLKNLIKDMLLNHNLLAFGITLSH